MARGDRRHCTAVAEGTVQPLGVGRFGPMSETSEAMLVGLPDRVQRLLADPPAMDKRLIELVVAWPGLTGGLARMADAVRLFVITWGPLAGIGHRPRGLATLQGVGGDPEYGAYLPTLLPVGMA